MAHNHQVGRILITRVPPLFEHLTVRGGTWTETDATKTQQEMDGNEETFNIAAYDQGQDVKCDVFPDSGFEPQVNDVLPETAESAAIAAAEGIDIWEDDGVRRWVITKIDRKQFGKRQLIFSLELIRRKALDATQVESS